MVRHQQKNPWEEHKLRISGIMPPWKEPGEADRAQEARQRAPAECPHEVPHEKALTVGTPREKGGCWEGGGDRGPNFKNIINEE